MIDDQNKELLKYLANLGIEITKHITDPDEDETFIKIDDSTAAWMDSLLQATQTIALGETYNGTYRAVFDKGLGVLQKSAQHPGMVLGNVVNPLKNNDIRDVARWEMVSAGPQLVSGLFSAASIATGQYYMTQINTRLDHVDNQVANITSFLDSKERSRLQADEEFLKSTLNKMPVLYSDKTYQQSTLTSIQKIKLDAMGKQYLYKDLINTKEAAIKEEKNNKVIEEAMKDIAKYIPEYYIALYVYSLATYTETIALHNMDEAFISSQIKDIEMKIEQYKNDCETWNKNINMYIGDSKAYDPKKVLEVLSAFSGGSNIMLNGVIANPAMVVTKGVGTVAKIFNETDKDQKQKSQERAYKYLEIAMEDMKTADAPENIKTSIGEYKALCDGRIEILKKDDGIYIRNKAKEV